ncbi:MAG: hypothetical protein WCJ35_05030 [Planctomycetota bacterium]
MFSGWSKVGQALGSLLVLLLLYPAPAFAHKLYVYAQLKGTLIQGRVYFPGDVPARKIDVIARDPSGRELDRTTTDDDGKFTFTAREHVDHYLVAETLDGHGGGPYIVHATEFSGRLPAKGPTTESGSQVKLQATDASVPAASTGNENKQATVTLQLTELRTQLDELRQQIFESDERLRFRDILGGIGFILGLAGVAFYMKARKGGT